MSKALDLFKEGLIYWNNEKSESIHRKGLIVDEASVVHLLTLYELLPFVLYFKSLVFAGDTNQRSPFCSTTYEPKSVLNFVEQEAGKQVDLFIKHSFLDIQFRMRPDLGTVISDNFYGGRVRNFKQSTGRKTCYFYDLKSSVVKERGKARNAPEEMREAHRMAAAFTRVLPNYEIAVLTAYNAQYYYFEKLCTTRPLGEDLLVKTLDVIPLTVFKGRRLMC